MSYSKRYNKEYVPTDQLIDVRQTMALIGKELKYDEFRLRMGVACKEGKIERYKRGVFKNNEKLWHWIKEQKQK